MTVPPESEQGLDSQIWKSAEPRFKNLEQERSQSLKKWLRQPLHQCCTWSSYRIAIQPDSAIQNRFRIGRDFENISTGSDMDIQTALITAVECLNQVFFRYKPDWI